MAIAVTMEIPGGTLAQYDEVFALMGFENGGKGAPGGLFHWAAAIEGGIVVTDVWESLEQFEAFAAEKILPYVALVGLTPGERKV
jgi:hypothetical protein